MIYQRNKDAEKKENGIMTNQQATYDDANLILKLYELRREEKLRAARDWFSFKFLPGSLEDFKVIREMGAIENTYFRMVTSYWDMAASFVAQGVLNAELFFQSGGEMFFIWAKIEEFVPSIRESMSSPHYLAHMEKAISMVPWGAERVAAAKQALKQMREQAAKSAKS
jgi:hypothetical protein